MRGALDPQDDRDRPRIRPRDAGRRRRRASATPCCSTTIARTFPEVAGDAEDAEAGRPPEAQRRARRLRHPLIWSGEIHYDHDSDPRAAAQHLRDAGRWSTVPRRCPRAPKSARPRRGRPAFRHRQLGARRPGRPPLPGAVRHGLPGAGQAGSGAAATGKRPTISAPARTRIRLGRRNGSACRSTSSRHELEGFLKR